MLFVLLFVFIFFYFFFYPFLFLLDDASSVSTLLDDLLRNEEESKYLLAYQVAFDLCENENQKFSQDISTGLPINPFTKITPSTTTPSDTSAESGSALSEDQMMANIEASRAALAADGEAVTPTAAATDAAPFPEDHIYWSKLNTLRSILVGGLSVRLYLQFLYKNNRADLILLGQIKDKLPERNSVCHGACVTAHSYMHCGTTVDTFLRKNLEWLSKASNWVRKKNEEKKMKKKRKGEKKIVGKNCYLDLFLIFIPPLSLYLLRFVFVSFYLFFSNNLFLILFCFLFFFYLTEQI